MKRTVLTTILVVIGIVVVWYAVRRHATAPAVPIVAESTARERRTGDDLPSGSSQECVVGMGRIEPAGGVIDVGATMGDRLGTLLVKEDQRVKKNQPLADLESRDLRSLQLDAAKLNVKKAKAADLGTAAYQQKTELLKVALALAKKDQERLKGLSKELVTDQERERQALVVQQAASELESAQAVLRQMLRANELGLEAAQLELRSAEAQYARSQVVAPCDGTILKTYIRPGETIGAKPILQMANLGQMVVVVEVYENEIKHLRSGQPAQVTSRAFIAPYDQKGLQGKVTRVGRMINNPMLKSVDPFAPADRHVVEVRVELDEEGSRQSAAFSNLQVDVRFPKRD
jgi:HlyD family secretion protein